MPSEWTIDTLKEHFEQQFAALHEREKIRAEALKLQAAEYERRLEALNGEQSRIAANQASSVSREIWEASQREDRDWKRRIDLALGDKLSLSEFHTYKDLTDKTLTLKAGQSQGISTIGAILVQLCMSLAGIAAIVTVLILFLRR